MGPEKRKHTRVTHKGAVEFVTENRTFHGTSLNLSRNGMQIVVNLPESYAAIRSITFQLQAVGERIEVPCRLVRSARDEQEHTLGIEFQPETDAQLLLIEKFIQEEARRTAESRQLPRTDCRIEGVQIDRAGVQVLSVDNISAEGLLFTFTGELDPMESVSLVLYLPEDKRPLRLQGTVVYVIEQTYQDFRTAGFRFRPLKETAANRLRNFIVASSAGSALKNLYGYFQSNPPDPEFHIQDPREIHDLLQTLWANRCVLNILFEGRFSIWERCLARLDAECGEFELLETDGADTPPAATGNAYFTFFLNDSSHYFKTKFSTLDPAGVRFSLPEVIYRSDKRSYRRKNMGIGSPVTLVITSDENGEKEFSGTLSDISRRGFLCTLAVPRTDQAFFRVGNMLRYRLAENLGLDDCGQIRHVRSLQSGNEHRLQIGIEAGITRQAPQRRRIPIEEWLQNPGIVLPGPIDQEQDSLAVRYENPAGQELCALINATRLSVPAPVVVIPPAYGKKKEAFAPLVATLLDNFRAQQRDLVVMRYDGINRPGESHQEIQNPRRGYEMLSYRISQGLEDLQATLQYIHRNPHFQATQVILICFSMAAIDARRLLSSGDETGVDLWISCMGVPAAQSTLRNSLGGIDIINNFRMGIPNGIMGLLGHLINMDIMAGDLVEKKYAYLTDARIDMSRVGVPVLWICGDHDRWVELAEVEDIMSVRSENRRDMVVIPAGHNLRTSTDAIRTFKLITSHLYHFLHGERIQAADPRHEELIRLVAAERERLTSKTDIPLGEYWREYLLGSERNSVGYDFYKNFEEFNDFLAKQVELLELREKEVIVDLGSGTGLFLEALLQAAATKATVSPNFTITAIDLVPEALEKAQEKCDRLLAVNPSLKNVRIDYISKNLEPNRLIPVSLFVHDADLSYDYLRNKIDGLTNATIDRLLRCACPEANALMRGNEPTEALMRPLQATLPSEDIQVVMEFNQAARLLTNGAAKGLFHAKLETKILRFGDLGAFLDSGLPDQGFSRIVASLFISYLFNPEYLLAECFRLLRPDGIMLVSSMKPDSDISTIFTNYIHGLRDAHCQGENRLSGALAMLNAAASLFELEEDGLFRFYSSQELNDLLRKAGFSDIAIYPALGSPPQALIAIGKK